MNFQFQNNFVMERLSKLMLKFEFFYLFTCSSKGINQVSKVKVGNALDAPNIIYQPLRNTGWTESWCTSEACGCEVCNTHCTIYVK